MKKQSLKRPREDQSASEIKAETKAEQLQAIVTDPQGQAGLLRPVMIRILYETVHSLPRPFLRGLLLRLCRVMSAEQQRQVLKWSTETNLQPQSSIVRLVAPLAAPIEQLQAIVMAPTYLSTSIIILIGRIICNLPAESLVVISRMLSDQISDAQLIQARTARQQRLNQALSKAVGDNLSLELVVRPLLEEKADPNAISNANDPVLFKAMFYGTPALVQSLLDAKAEPNQKSHGGDVPLHVAAVKGDMGIASKLIEAKASVNVTRSDDYTTPLDIIAATEGDHVDFVKLLLAAKANHFGEPGKQVLRIPFLETYRDPGNTACREALCAASRELKRSQGVVDESEINRFVVSERPSDEDQQEYEEEQESQTSSEPPTVLPQPPLAAPGPGSGSLFSTTATAASSSGSSSADSSVSSMGSEPSR